MQKWQLFENGYLHTSGLKKEDADEMLERHQRIFPELEFYIMQDEVYPQERDCCYPGFAPLAHPLKVHFLYPPPGKWMVLF